MISNKDILKTDNQVNTLTKKQIKDFIKEYPHKNRYKEEIDLATEKPTKEDIDGLYVVNPLNGERIAWKENDHKNLLKQMMFTLDALD